MLRRVAAVTVGSVLLHCARCSTATLTHHVDAAGSSKGSVREMASARARAGGPRIRAEKRTIIVEPPEESVHTSTVIWMHGLGDTAHGWIDVCAEVLAPALPHTKFVLPTARTQPVTINGGMPMPAWYDIESLAADRSLERCAGIHDSVREVRALIDAERAAGISKIVLAGFSQGGAMALFTGLAYPHRLTALLVLSGYLPLPSDIKLSPHAPDLPCLLLHGDADGVVPLAFARDALDRVKAMGVKHAALKVFSGMPHSAREDELEDALTFLRDHLA